MFVASVKSRCPRFFTVMVASEDSKIYVLTSNTIVKTSVDSSQTGCKGPLPDLIQIRVEPQEEEFYFLSYTVSTSVEHFLSGFVGDDEFGHMLASILRENKVMDQGIRFDPSARTALAFVTLKVDGEREFMFYRNPSADMLLQESELDKDLIQKASIFHYGSISLIAEPTRSAHLAAMEVAKQGGALLSYDPNLRLPLWPSAEKARKGILSIWDKADLIKVSDEEVAFLTGGDPDDDEVVMSLWHPRLTLLLVTYGQKGCKYYTKSFSGMVASIPVKAIDTTGAGDAFVGGLLCQIINDMSVLKDEQKLKEALRFANGCGAITTTKKGAIPAMPDKSAVLELLKNFAM